GLRASGRRWDATASVSRRPPRRAFPGLRREHRLGPFDVRDGLPEHDLLQVGLVGHTQDGRRSFDDGDLLLAPAQGDRTGRDLTVRFLLEAGYQLGDLSVFLDAFGNDLHVEGLAWLGHHASSSRAKQLMTMTDWSCAWRVQ